MNRKEAAKILPIIKAYAEGKEIEGLYKGTKSPWFKIKDMDFNEGIIFRIKPELKYRPFANAEECWTEMQKHEPFGWVIKFNEGKILIGEVPSGGVVIHNQRGSMYDFDEANRILTFADGTPFGILEEE